MNDAIAKATRSAQRANKKLLASLQAITPPMIPTDHGADLVQLVTPFADLEKGVVGIKLTSAVFTEEEALLLRDQLNHCYPPERHVSSFGRRCHDFCERNPDHEKSAELAKYSPTPIVRKKSATTTNKKRAQPANKQRATKAD